MDRAGTRWDGHETERLVQCVRDHGPRWAVFVDLFNGRSTGALKKKYKQLLVDGLVPEVAAGMNQHGVGVPDLNQHPEEDEQLLDQNVINPAPAPGQNEVNPASALLNATSGQGDESQSAQNFKEALLSAIKIVVREETISEDGCINKAIKEEINRQQGG